MVLLLVAVPLVSADLVETDTDGNVIGTSPAQIRSIVNEAVRESEVRIKQDINDGLKRGEIKIDEFFSYIKGQRIAIALLLVSSVVGAMVLGSLILFIISHKKRKLEARLYETRLAERQKTHEETSIRTFQTIYKKLEDIEKKLGDGSNGR